MAASDVSDSGSNHEDQTDVVMETDDHYEHDQDSDADMDEDDANVVEDKVEIVSNKSDMNEELDSHEGMFRLVALPMTLLPWPFH